MGSGGGSNLHDVSCTCWRHLRVIRDPRVICGRTDQLRYDVIALSTCLPSQCLSPANAEQSNYWTRMATYTGGRRALTSTWRCSKYNPPTECRCHCTATSICQATLSPLNPVPKPLCGWKRSCSTGSLYPTSHPHLYPER